jgi:ribulose kinase
MESGETAMNDERVIGADFGTEGVRVALFGPDGAIRGTASQSYPTRFPAPGRAEQEPAAWWQALGAATREVLATSGTDAARVVGFGYDATACSVVLAERSGAAIGPALIWMDVRASAEAGRITPEVSAATRYHAGTTASAEWLPPKVAWLATHEPERYARAEVIGEFVDWIGFHLTDRWTTSLNNASTRWYYSSRDGGWPEDLYEHLGIADAIDRFPGEVLPLGENRGGLTPAAASHLGLRTGTPVAQGGADAFVAMLGLGVTGPGRIALITGSSHLQLAQAPGPAAPDGLFGGFPDAVVPDMWMLEGGQVSTGSIARWFRKLLEVGGDVSYATLDRLAAEVAPGADGLVLLDYWQGNRTPHTDARARGALWGMTLHHGPGHLWRAILEGVGYGTASVIDAMRSAGVEGDEVRICGGACNSELWLQIHADTAGIPLVVPEVTAAAALGSAVTAAVTAGWFPTLPDASEAMVRIARTIEPDPTTAETYAFYRERYGATYAALADEMHLVSDRVSDHG